MMEVEMDVVQKIDEDPLGNLAGNLKETLVVKRDSVILRSPAIGMP